MRRPGDRRRVQRLFFQVQEALGQSIELVAHLLDCLPLLGELIGKLFDRLRLMSQHFFQSGDAGCLVLRE